MKTLKKMIRQSLYARTGVSVFCLLVVLLFMHLGMGSVRAYDDAHKNIQHIKSLLIENQRELRNIKEEYRTNCIHSAEIISKLLESDPSLIHNVPELREIATAMDIVEIHIFDSTGHIIAGTHPQYYGYSLDSGEQMSFFTPLLRNKTLKLVQSITPNTAENRPMQYSAIWNENRDYIIQVGVDPVNVTKVTGKNELSHIFSHFRINPDINYYAIDKDSGEMVGATCSDCVGNNIQEIGGSLEQISTNTKGFYALIDDEWSYCVFELINQNYIGQVVAVKNLFHEVPSALFWALLSLLIISYILVQAVAKYLEVHVIAELDKVNNTLQSITDGNLEEKLDLKSSVEFDRLSTFINLMINSLLENTMKISYALSKTNMFIGTYEYGNRAKAVQYTEYIPTIFSLSDEEVSPLMRDKEKFVSFLDDVKRQSDSDTPGVYYHGGKFIRIDESESCDEVFGVAIDVTSEMTMRKKIEHERDIDILTGLYNRRALNARLKELFSNLAELKHAAMVMIDADGLKWINDTYGHEKGDIYLKEIAATLRSLPSKSSVIARQGGDEYVLFLYHYDSEEELFKDLQQLEHIQNNHIVDLGDQVQAPLRFSFGYSIVDGVRDPHRLLKDADKKMYENKLKRKA